MFLALVGPEMINILQCLILLQSLSSLRNPRIKDDNENFAFAKHFDVMLPHAGFASILYQFCKKNKNKIK